MTSNENIEKLAKEMNVTPVDVLNFAKLVVSGLQRDGVVNHLVKASPENQEKVLKAYVVSEAKRYEDFMVTCRTNDAAMSAMADRVYWLLVGDAK